MAYLVERDAYQHAETLADRYAAEVGRIADAAPVDPDFIRQLAALRSHPGANEWALEAINDYLISQAQDAANSADEDIDWRDVLKAWTGGVA